MKNLSKTKINGIIIGTAIILGVLLGIIASSILIGGGLLLVLGGQFVIVSFRI